MAESAGLGLARPDTGQMAERHGQRNDRQPLAPVQPRDSSSGKVIAWSRLNGPEAVRRSAARWATVPAARPRSAASTRT